jgi:mycofactocin system glycosyltransferase
VIIDASAKFLDHDFIAGGSPWRLLRLRGGSKEVANRWRDGGEVRPGEERLARTLIQQGLLHPLTRSATDIGDIDVIIPVHDAVASLRSLLAMLDQLHVTIVDDGSTSPNSLAQCAQEFNAQLVRLEVNRGPAAARNAGAHATVRPLMWFIDSDVSLDNALDVLQRLAGHMSDPLVSAVAPRIRGDGGSSARDRFEQRFSPLDMGPNGGLVVPASTVSYVPSACLLVRRSAFGEGFDEALRTGEDVDLVWRLHDRGWLIRYDADVHVGHRARGDWRQWWSQRVRYGVSSGQLASRHGGRLAPVRVDVWTLAAWTSAVFGRPLIGVRIMRLARDRMRERVSESADHPDEVANAVVARGMLRAGLPLARAVVRTFGGAVLLAVLHPRLRRRALVLFAVGTLARGRSVRLRLGDVPLAIADDLAYGVGVVKGAWQTRSLTALRPQISASSMRLSDVVGLRRRRSQGD